MDGINGNITLKFASILTDIYMSIDVKNYSDRDDYNNKLSKKFKLDLNKYEHGIIESCRFLIEDTEGAIINYEEYGLSGPTKYKNSGESYLRLYGLLNALYLQMSIPKVLREVFKLDKNNAIQKLKNRFKKLKIIEFRHKMAAHSLEYNNGSNYYRLSQKSFSFAEIHLVGKDGLEKINLQNELTVFKKVLQEELYLVLDEIAKKLFVPKSKRVSSIENSLEYVKLQMDDPLVILPYSEEEEIIKIMQEIERKKKDIKILELVKIDNDKK